MKKSIVRAGLVVLLASTTAFGLAACGGSGDSASGGQSGSSAGADSSSEVDVTPDLEAARQAVLDALADDPNWGQVMLAADVDHPTEKYGLLVMPFVASDASSRVQGTVTIEGGKKFTIEADSAATGKTWQIDQDGKITEVTK